MELSKVGQLEALLFASGDPLTLEKMASILHLSLPDTEQLLQELSEKYNTPDSGLMLRQVAGGWQLVTRQEAVPVIRELHEKQEIKLSNAAMETLAIVAYKQPVTKSEIEAIRGVKVDGVVNTLTDLELILEVGRKEVIGRPVLYGTTEKFLVTFGLESLNDLPELPEELLDRPEPAETEDKASDKEAEQPETAQTNGD
ncbi:MAG: SMC-Scp complex subunit ScpB [Acidaminococcus sp.]|jgi:segregation and condensation protein B|nr:SMC-Scp complex subunit ScpB [Acidaminococcus sp.]MCI2099466.1 SMC-Scp complex subunit ScpB [Acidaminococcus sp.]MCI2113826.1 SMC-Scp complex subunit ScpB [Acidaminococcus sp.]MCI2115600.1 SMC-Scp complex subunit ScpB [Acidaminococcus sp.]